MSQGLKTYIRELLPDPWSRGIRDYRNIAPSARWTYFRLWFRRALGRKPPSLEIISAEVSSLLMICRGNIIRSPMAAALLRRFLVEGKCVSIRVESAGTDAEPGRGAESRAIRLSQEFGVSLSNHVAQPVTETLLDASDLILVMDRRNEAELIARFPRSRKKVYLLGALTGSGSSNSIEILDPLYGSESDIRSCYELLSRLVRELAGALARAAGKN